MSVRLTTRQRQLVAAASFLLGWSRAVTAAGFETPLPLGELIGTADVVVVGTIVRVSASTFALTVDQIVAGRLDEPQIQVERFRAPETSPRWAPYGRDQNVLLFLARGTLGRTPPEATSRILGRIGEGEIPLDAQFAYFHSRYVDPLQPDYHQVDGQRVYLQRFDRAATLDAVRSYRSCFQWGDQGGGLRRPKITCSATSLAAYRSRSALHDFLVREAEAVLAARMK